MTANHVVLHCSIIECVMSPMSYFISFFMGVAMGCLVSFGCSVLDAPARNSLAPTHVQRAFWVRASGAERIERADVNLQTGALRSKGNMTATLPLHSAHCSGKKCLMLTESAFIWPKSTVKANLKSFRIIIPVFSVTWSFRNHSDMLIWCSKNFFIVMNVESSCAA